MDVCVLKQVTNVVGFSCPLLLGLHLYFSYFIFFPSCGQLTCGICFETYPRARIETASCGHPYCISCWTGIACVQSFFLLWPQIQSRHNCEIMLFEHTGHIQKPVAQ